MLRTLLAGVFLAHGIAHVVGFVVPWRIVTSAEVPYRTTVLGTDVGPIAVRALGIAWLIVACLLVECQDAPAGGAIGCSVRARASRGQAGAAGQRRNPGAAGARLGAQHLSRHACIAPA